MATAFALALAAKSGTPASFALLAGGMGAVAVLANAIDFGNNTWILRETARGTLQRDIFSSLVRTKFVLGLIVSVVLGGALGLLPHQLPTVLVLGLTGMLLSRVLVSSYSSWLLGNGKFLKSGALLSLERLTGLCLMLLFWWRGAPPIQWLPLCFTLGSGLALGVALTSWIPSCNWPSRGPLTPLKQFWGRSSAFGVQSVATDALLLDSWIVSLVATPTVGGEVGLASRLIAPIGLVGQALASVSLSLRARSTGVASASAFMPVLFVAALLSTAAFTAPQWLVKFFGPQYEGAVVPFMVFCAVATVRIANQLVVSHLHAAGREKSASRVIVPGAIAALTLLAMGAAAAGAPGASTGVLLANLGTFSALVWTRSRPAA